MIQSHSNRQGNTLASEKISFSFGKNWQDFLGNADQKQYADLITSLKEILQNQLAILQNGTFLDVGSGSGLFSMAAFQLGAKRVISVDLDPASVFAAQSIRERVGSPPNWEVVCGSILDETFIRSLPLGDVVYCWGVAHHTGNMWKACRNLARLVQPGGILVIALYNYCWSAPLWHKIKRFYNRQGGLGQWLLSRGLFLIRATARLIRGRHPWRDVRGMSILWDAVDWLGGLPYEYATAETVRNFFKSHGMTLVKETITRGSGCNEFLFRKAQP